MTMAIKNWMAESKGYPLDVMISVVLVFLLSLGFIMVGSASTDISARIYGDPLYLFLRHSVYMVISFAAAGLVLSVPVDAWKKTDWLWLLVSFALLIAVLVPGIGRTVNGATRWISLGFMTLQGSEFVKLFAVVYISGHLVRRRADIDESISGFIRPLVLISVLVLLLLEQPDFGASVVILASVMGVIFLAGVPFRHFIPVISVFIVATLVIAQWQPYRLDRFASFTDPWTHQFNEGYQLTQALIAFGRGEWLGMGLGNSIQKLFYLPEAHTDFLFSILAEELGAIVAAAVIIAFAVLVLRGLVIGRRALDAGLEFHGYLAFGIALLLGIQSAINIGVNIGLLPTKGLTLPFVSYGGNSLIVSCIVVSILLRIEYEVRASNIEPTSRQKVDA
ncbi:MAG: putative lipid II flippase FtsW [Pseudomonadales bacterium]|nr:putative lipid II flippase FtsW [Pseudomonadales bacterium]